MLVLTVQLVCLVAGIVYGIPQLIRVFRARTAVGVSLLSWQLMGATTTAWVLHGVLQGSPVVIWSNLVGTLSSAVLLWWMIRERRLGAWRTLWPTFARLAVCIALRCLLGPVVFAGFIVVPQLAAQSGQLLELIRARLLTGVSALFLWFGVFLQAVWGVYGVLLHDVAVIIAATCTLVVNLLNVVWFHLRGLHIVGPHPGFLRRTVADALDPEPRPDAVVPAGGADPVG